MNPIDTSGLAKYLGPGTGGLWMGEQQRNAMQESEINQQKGLEDIMTQQQTRDIQRQKLPFELQQAEQNVFETKGRVAKQKTEEEDRLQKLDKQNVSDFMGAILLYQGVDNPLDNAFQLQALAQKYKLDPNDPRIRSIMSNSMDKEGIKKMQDALIQSDPKWIADRKKALEEKEKSDNEIAGRRDVAQIQGQTSRDVANIQADSREAVAALRQQATAKLANIEQELVQLSRVINDQNSSAQDKQMASQRAQQLLAAKQSIATAVVQGKADQLQAILNPGASATMPSAAPGAIFPAQPTAQFDPNKQYTPAEAKNLPKGTKFKGTDGKTYEVQ